MLIWCEITISFIYFCISVKLIFSANSSSNGLIINGKLSSAVKLDEINLVIN